ncbi:uncharacterized protein PV09_01497 [Verruconis gallopava]|uniref:Uncharacterized protein n=1 Tax=Verruconis gallopava TaxID=253628 RepID=A0A0D2AM57_9PEZI|nr:uncharacterized protein PV09_01497 [Verruconis gallopava]KIW07535.1 hypothetical protein PV09_01497 [Verruconis gallopava]
MTFLSNRVKPQALSYCGDGPTLQVSILHRTLLSVAMRGVLPLPERQTRFHTNGRNVPSARGHRRAPTSSENCRTERDRKNMKEKKQNKRYFTLSPCNARLHANAIPLFPLLMHLKRSKRIRMTACSWGGANGMTYCTVV